MDYSYETNGQTARVQVEPEADGYLVTVGGRSYHVTARRTVTGALAMTIDNRRRCLAYVAADGPNRWVAVDSGESAGQTFLLTVPETTRRPQRAAASGPAALEAQMPGIVRRVLVTEGEPVTRGQMMVLMEAMKMEIRVTAPQAGTVARVAVTAGQTVERGQLLVALARAAADPPG